MSMNGGSKRVARPLMHSRGDDEGYDTGSLKFSTLDTGPGRRVIGTFCAVIHPRSRM
jgi:hypothetical protein